MSNKTLRATKQRHAIRKAFDAANRPLGPKEILQIAGRSVPNLGIATVYRNIKVMIDEGELETVELPGQAARYQPPADENQQLLICEKDDSVFTINKEIDDFHPDLPDGFVLKRYQIIYYGDYEESPDKPSRR